MSMNNNKVQGFLQHILISEISVNDLKNLQPKVQLDRNHHPSGASKLYASKQDVNPVDKVKVTFNRPKFSQNCGNIREELLEFSINDLPALSTNLEDSVISELKELSEDIKLFLEFQQSLPNDSDEINDAQKISMPKINNPNQSLLSEKNSIGNLFNSIKVDKEGEKKDSFFYQSSQKQMSKSQQEEFQKFKEVDKFQKETGLSFEEAARYIETFLTFENAKEEYFKTFAE